MSTSLDVTQSLGITYLSTKIIIEALAPSLQLRSSPMPSPDALCSFGVDEQIVDPVRKTWEHLEATARAT
jgi:hypothetical protein